MKRSSWVRRNWFTVVCLAVPAAYSLVGGQAAAWIGHSAGNLAYLPVQFSQDHRVQKAQRARGEEWMSFGDARLAPAYRQVQFALAPVSDCPPLSPDGLQESVGVPEAQEEQLAKWVESGSVIPICLERRETEQALDYYARLVQAAPGVAAEMDELPKRIARQLVERANARYRSGDVDAGYGDWVRAERVLAGRPYEVFGDLAERLSLEARPAQQEYLRRDLAGGKNDMLVSIYLANSYNESGGYHEAASVVAPLLSRAPSDTRAWQQLGQALMGQRRFEEAEEAFKEAVRLAPREAGALNRLGVLYTAWGRLGDAESAFRQALDTSEGPSSYWIWEHLGDVLAAQGRVQSATEAYRAAIAHAPPELEGPAREKLATVGSRVER